MGHHNNFDFESIKLVSKLTIISENRSQEISCTSEEENEKFSCFPPFHHLLFPVFFSCSCTFIQSSGINKTKSTQFHFYFHSVYSWVGEQGDQGEVIKVDNVENTKMTNQMVNEDGRMSDRNGIKRKKEKKEWRWGKSTSHEHEHKQQQKTTHKLVF